MPLLALTGGIAAGKSTISRMLQEHGALIVDADAIVREVQAPGSPVLDEIAEAFGREMIDPDGALDRVIGLPVPGPTDLALGGADGATLFITSARHSVSIESLGNAPLSGRIFSVNLDENGQIPA